MANAKDGTQSVQLGIYDHFTSDDNVVTLHYDREDGDKKGANTGKYLKGTLGENSINILKNIKKGDKFVVVKEAKTTKDGKQFWNVVELRSADTFVPKEKKEWKGKNNYEKKEYDQTGVKVGAARNQAIAYLSAIQGDNFDLDDVDRIAYEIVRRQAIMEDNVRKNIDPNNNDIDNNPNVDTALMQQDDDYSDLDDIPF